MSSSSRKLPAHALVQNGVGTVIASGSDASVLLVEKTLASQCHQHYFTVERFLFLQRQCGCFVPRAGKCQALIMSSDTAAVTSHFGISVPAGVAN